MGNDFDQDDLSWLRGDNDDDQDDNAKRRPDDDLNFDWLQDSDEDAPARPEGRTGVTGELSWLGDQPSKGETPTTEDNDDFDWLRQMEADQPTAGGNQRLGVTGQLNWLQDDADDTTDEPRPDSGRSGVTGQLDWRKASFEDQLDSAEQAAGVDWGLPADDEDTFAADTAQPDWLTQAVDDNAGKVDQDEARSDDDLAALFDDLSDDTTGQGAVGGDDDLAALFGDTADEDEFDFMGSLGAAAPSTINDDERFAEFLNQSPVEDEADEDDPFNWFDDLPAAAPAASPAANVDDLDWLQSLETGSDDSFTEDEFNFDDLPGIDPAVAALDDEPPLQPEFDDVDSFLASLGSSTGLALPETEFTPEEDVEFDELFSDPAFAALDQAPERSPLPTAPDFLADVSVSDVSAAAIVRRQKDRPLEELPDRLLALREESYEIGQTAPATGAAAAANLLPDLEDALPAAPIATVAPTVAGALDLSAEQQRKVNLLTALAAPAALTEEAQVRTRRRPRIRISIGRLLIAVLVAAAVIAPFFVSALRIGELPPITFAANSPQMGVFQQVESLSAGDRVLFAFEYGATAAGELDSLTEALLRHVMVERGAQPVIVSSNAVALLRAENLAEAVAGGAFIPGTDYFIGRYIVGENIGLRAFATDITALTAADVQGQPTNLNITSLDDFALIIVIAESSDAVRSWSEQVAPLTTAPLVFATGYAAAPLAQPYAQLGDVNGVLVGYRDAYTYSAMLDGSTGNIVPVPTEEPATETAAPTIESTEEPAAVVTEGVTEEAAEIDATATEPEPTATPTARTPTATEPEPSATPTEEEVTATPEATEAATEAADVPARTGRVISDQTVNVREGAGQGFPVVTTLQPGTIVEIIGEDEDAGWFNIRLDDGTEGWISSALIEIEAEGEAYSLPLGLGAGMGVGIAQAQTPTLEPESTAEATPEPTEVEPDPTATAENTSTIVDPAQTVSTGEQNDYRDERWYGMTMGLIVCIGVIVVGNIISIVRNFTQRNQ